MRIQTRDRSGFTLLELLVVVAIIGIIVAFITAAAADGIRRAEERQTQALIVKLETAVADRMDALMLIPAPVNRAHKWLAAIHSTVVKQNDSLNPFGVIPSQERAQIIARIDMIRAEMPETWFPLGTPLTASGATYLVSYGGNAYPSNSAGSLDAYTLPMGARVLDTSGGAYSSGTITTSVLKIDGQSGYPFDPTYDLDGSGILGASYGAAAGIAKGLGAKPQGHDGVDNDGNGYTDDYAEWIFGEAVGGPTDTLIRAHLASHDPKTARAEMLYAVLVEGQGALGSVFSSDSFTDREVRDTDGDGLPEFVDAWGEPIQFFRWPTYYIDSDLGVTQPTPGVPSGNNASLFQRGYLPYNSTLDLRQQCILDPAQTLVAPAWWGTAVNDLAIYASPSGLPSPPATISTSALEFQRQFFSLLDPDFAGGGGTKWDRSGQSLRRAYFCKHLVISSGPDKTLGIGLITDPTAISPLTLILIENQAAQASLVSDGGGANRSGVLYQGIASVAQPFTPALSLSSLPSYTIYHGSMDDISNQNLSGPGTGVR